MAQSKEGTRENVAPSRFQISERNGNHSSSIKILAGSGAIMRIA